MSKKRHHEEHEEHVNHEAWVIPYADMLTLLMAMFLVLWAVGNTDQEKVEAVATTFRAQLGEGKVVDPGIETTTGEGLLEGATIWPLQGIISSFLGENGQAQGAIALQTQLRQQAQAAAAEQELADIETELQGELTAALQQELASGEITEQEITELEESVQFRQEDRGLVVTIVTDQVLFNAGSAALQPDGLGLLGALGRVLASLDYEFIVEGHTDSRPINTAQFPSNWELSTSRATSVLRYLVDKSGVDVTKIRASGYADTRPLDTNDTVEGRARNRRVELVILSKAGEPVDLDAFKSLTGATDGAEGGEDNG